MHVGERFKTSQICLLLKAVLLFFNEPELMKFLCSVSHGYIKLHCSFCWAPEILASECNGLPADWPLGFVVSLKFAALTLLASG